MHKREGRSKGSKISVELEVRCRKELGFAQSFCSCFGVPRFSSTFVDFVHGMLNALDAPHGAETGMFLVQGLPASHIFCLFLQILGGDILGNQAPAGATEKRGKSERGAIEGAHVLQFDWFQETKRAKINGGKAPRHCSLGVIKIRTWYRVLVNLPE